MLEIYKPYVLESAISFETSVPTLGDFESRFSTTIAKYPWLALEVDDQVAAYAYAGVFKNRSAYDWSVESTIYVDRNFHKQGLGKALYQELIATLKNRGILNIIGIIALPNEPSVALHETLGFKFDRWWDVGYWQLQLAKPKHPTPIQF